MNRPIYGGTLADDRDRGQDFARGDVVFRINPLTTAPIPLPGLVTAVIRGIGVVVVEFPWGSERLQMDEVVRAAPSRLESLPPSKDTSYSSYDVTQSRLEDGTLSGKGLSDKVAAQHSESALRLRILAAKEMFHLKTAAEATVSLLQEHGAVCSKSAIHEAVRHVFTVLPSFRFRTSSQNYQPTQVELNSGSFACPRCHSKMARMLHHSKMARLYGCPTCLFLADPSAYWLPGKGVSGGMQAQDRPVVVAEKEAARWNDDARGVYEECFESGRQDELEFDTVRNKLTDSALERTKEHAMLLSDPNLRNLDPHQSNDGGFASVTGSDLPVNRWEDRE